MSRGDDLLLRSGTFAAGAALGVAPLLVYQWRAFGSVFHVTYENAVRRPGVSGHDVLGANVHGLFGVGVPSTRTAIALLFESRGLLTVSPVLALSIVGLVLLYRRGVRAEALLIAAVSGGLLLMNAGYETPFGGNSAGPRFLIPALPFLVLALAPVYGRLPGVTIGLAVASASMLAVATLTRPMLPTHDTAEWPRRLVSGDLQDTLVTFAGPDSWTMTLALFLIPLAVAIALAARATGRMAITRTDRSLAFAALGFWVLVASAAPRIGSNPGYEATLHIVAAAAMGSIAVWIASERGEPRTNVRVASAPR